MSTEPFVTEESQRQELAKLHARFWSVVQARYTNEHDAYHPRIGTALRELADLEYRINDPALSTSIGAMQDLCVSIHQHLYDAIPRVKIDVA